MNPPVADDSRIGIKGPVHGHYVIGQVFGPMYVSTELPRSVFDVLKPHVVLDALYGSRQRSEEHAVTCSPETGIKILEEVRSWADSMTTPICWLSGPAGTGKTTVAHTIAKEYDKDGKLAASFFFWRKTGDRDDINKLVPTLAWQIAKIPSAKERMEEALELKNEARIPLSKLSLQDQLSKLLVHAPVADTNHAGPHLIVIDGLDECASQERIRRLIDWLRKNTTPFRFLLTSRPELYIKDRFVSGLGDGRVDVQALSLTESKDDIRTFFIEELKKIKQERLGSRGPSDWPPKSSIDNLVEKSEGLFVYAATAVRYIGGKGSPETLLTNVLNCHVGLDGLYSQVIMEAKEWNYFHIVMGNLMHVRYSPAISEFSRLLLAVNKSLEAHDIRSALDGCHSILAIPQDDTHAIESYHASLRDFLTDKSRSQDLCYAPATFHAQLMVGCLRVITKAFSDGSRASEYALISWLYHACLFLSAPSASEGLGGLKDEAEGLVKKIDVKWIKLWMIEALGWASVPYLRVQLTQEKVREWYMNLKIHY